MNYRIYKVPPTQVNAKHNLYETITARRGVLYHENVP